MSGEEIRCTGCDSHKQCTYGLVECTREHGVEKCNQCPQFPCRRINEMLARSEEYRNRCKDVCTQEEYAVLERAFFRKEENLKL